MNEQEILSVARERLGIAELNAMQRGVMESCAAHDGDVVLYAPTGSGKTLAFVIPLLTAMEGGAGVVQAVVVAPSRELALQLHRVLQALATGLKVTCCYGGHRVEDERLSLQSTPDIVVATPGRLLDHALRGHIQLRNARWLVLDEFDKALELGFDDEMRQLMERMPHLRRRVLTSATRLEVLPGYVRLCQPLMLDYLSSSPAPASRMTVWRVPIGEGDRQEWLCRLLLGLPDGKTIVFVNYREAVVPLHQALQRRHIANGMYHGGIEQVEREKAVAMFNNGSLMVLVTTDLASRGLDIDGVRHIVHYHLPPSVESYTHRNGRTARVQATGDIYVLLQADDTCPDFVATDAVLELPATPVRRSIEAPMATLHIKAGRKEKISRADVVGFIVNQAGLEAREIGHIDLHDHYTLVAVPRSRVAAALPRLQQSRIKGRRVRITLAHQR